MKKLNPWIVLPGYEALLAREAPLNSRSRLRHWTDWLSWSMNRDLPPSWRREIFKQALAALQTSQRAR